MQPTEFQVTSFAREIVFYRYLPRQKDDQRREMTIKDDAKQTSSFLVIDALVNADERPRNALKGAESL